MVATDAEEEWLLDSLSIAELGKPALVDLVGALGPVHKADCVVLEEPEVVKLLEFLREEGQRVHDGRDVGESQRLAVHVYRNHYPKLHYQAIQSVDVDLSPCQLLVYFEWPVCFLAVSLFFLQDEDMDLLAEDAHYEHAVDHRMWHLFFHYSPYILVAVNQRCLTQFQVVPFLYNLVVDKCNLASAAVYLFQFLLCTGSLMVQSIDALHLLLLLLLQILPIVVQHGYIVIESIQSPHFYLQSHILPNYYIQHPQQLSCFLFLLAITAFHLQHAYSCLSRQ